MRRPVVLLVAALLLGGCGAGAGTVAAAPGTSTGPSATATRTCGEPSPDTGPVDLRQVSLRTVDERLTATFRLTGPPAAVPGVLQLTLGIWGDDGAARRALDVRWVDGVPRVRVYDVEQAREQQLTVRPDVSGGTVTVRFPGSATAGLGRSWRWEAFATVDGTDVDDCPGG